MGSLTKAVCVYASVDASRELTVTGTHRTLVPEDIIKIMLATDNHIGYLERDPVRSQDAINTFEEILQLAVKHDVRRVSSTVCSFASIIF